MADDDNFIRQTWTGLLSLPGHLVDPAEEGEDGRKAPHAIRRVRRLKRAVQFIFAAPVFALLFLAYGCALVAHLFIGALGLIIKPPPPAGRSVDHDAG